MSYSGKQGQYDRPYHSIDLESSPVQQQYAPPNEEQMPLSPRASAMPVPTMAGVQNSQYPPRPAFQQTSSSASHGKQTHKSNTSWDVLGGMQKEWDNFDSRNASQAAFQYAEGDAPTTTFGKLYLFLLNTSIVTRWIIFIVPVLALLWIPGIISLTANKTASIWHVRLLWWSEWWSVLWVGWWAALAVAMSLPYFLRWTLGLGLPALRKYFDWLKALSRPLAFVGWSLAAFISYNPLIHNNMQTVDGVTPGSSANALTLIGRLLFGTVISAMILFGEKFGMQYVAYKFHETSYADRIQHQKKQLECLVILYRNSSHLDRNDTLRDGDARGGGSNLNPTKLLKAALKGVQRTAETTTSAFGNLATEIAGVSVLQPNSPAGMVSAALNSANKSRLLARRLYYSFRAEGADRIVLGDISRFFPNREMATFAFEMFDKDENGDSTKEEMEAALLEINTERLSLAASMKDVDSATKRLDAILMTLYFFVVLLVFAVMLDASISTLVTGAGTFLLGLSWLIGGSAQEVLTSIIFLFIKHPFDIGDGIEVDGVSYSVKEIRLLSTLLVDGRGADVQCPNTVLNGKNIVNRRRSGPMSETFEFTVGYGTSFEQLEQLRHRMLKFIQVQRRDYMPVFDVMVGDISDQGSMKLKVDIKYKSNWQQGALKAQRRNKWICELKLALRELKIFGPSGDPNAAAGPKEITMVPYVPPEPAHSAPTPPAYDNRQYNLSDSHAALLNQGTSNIFGDEDTLKMPQAHPGRGDVGSATTSGYTTPAQVTMSQQEAVLRSRVPPAGPPAASAGTSGLRGMPAPQNQAPPQPTRWASAEEIEMKQTQQ